MSYPVLFFLLILSFVASPVWAWQQVKVEMPLEDDSSFRQMERKVLRKGFNLAVIQEASRIVPGELDQVRSDILSEHLFRQIDDYILGYRIFARQELEDSMAMEMEVNVDSGALRAELQNLGVYYTSAGFWSYDLGTRGAGPEDFQLLQRLQLVTGVKVDADAETSVELQRIAGGQWSGIIRHKNLYHQITGGDLSDVWFGLWSYFFSQQEVVTALTQELTLVTRGWTTTEAVKIFNERLISWEKEVESGRILYVHNNVPDLRAAWSLTSFNADYLEKRLERYLPGRGVYFNIYDTNKRTR